MSPLSTRNISFFVLLIASAAEVFAQSKPEQTLLLVDDHYVLYRSGTERFLNPPTRHSSKPLVPQLERWETAIGWTSIYRRPQDGKYQLWYQDLMYDPRREVFAIYGKVWIDSLFDENGHRVRGFTRDDWKPLAGDSLRHAVVWNEKLLADLPAGRYQVRLHLERAAVYAVTVR